MFRVLVGLTVFFVLVLAPQIISETTYITSYASNIIFHGNVHEVVPGRLYRSSELDADRLTDVMREYGINTVIDLRQGGHAEFYEGTQYGERDVVESLGAEYVHCPLQASRAAQKRKIKCLLEAYKKVRMPILVHCTSGTHRSGVASAIWLLEHEGGAMEQAKEQLSIKYGYFSAERMVKSFFVQHKTIDYLIWDYDSASRGRDLSFEHWLRKVPEESFEIDGLQVASLWGD